MNAKVFHEMTNAELTAKLASLKEELYSLKFNHATGQLANTSTLVVCKKDIAKVMTILRARELNIVNNVGKKSKGGTK